MCEPWLRVFVLELQLQHQTYPRRLQHFRKCAETGRTGPSLRHCYGMQLQTAMGSQTRAEACRCWLYDGELWSAMSTGRWGGKLQPRPLPRSQFSRMQIFACSHTQ